MTTYREEGRPGMDVKSPISLVEESIGDSQYVRVLLFHTKVCCRVIGMDRATYDQ